MWKAIVFKELREQGWAAALGAAAYAYFLAGQMGVRQFMMMSASADEVPFLSSGILSTLVFVSLCFTITLGLRQSLSESVRGTWLFLLHRPIDRRLILGAKLAVGAGLYLLCGAAMILVYSWWAATAGTHRSPFRWSMTLDTWRALLSMVPIYLAAFLSGIRPARWFGSRLLPLVGTGTLVLFLQTAGDSWLQWWLNWRWWYWGPAAMALLSAVLVALILDVARKRDFS